MNDVHDALKARLERIARTPWLLKEYTQDVESLAAAASHDTVRSRVWIHLFEDGPIARPPYNCLCHTQLDDAALAGVIDYGLHARERFAKRALELLCNCSHCPPIPRKFVCRWMCTPPCRRYYAACLIPKADVSPADRPAARTRCSASSRNTAYANAPTPAACAIKFRRDGCMFVTP